MARIGYGHRLEVAQRITAPAVEEYLVVTVASGREARVPDVSEHVAATNCPPGSDRERPQVCDPRDVAALAVNYVDRATVRRVLRDGEHDAVCRGPDRRALRRRDVHAHMGLHASPNGVIPGRTERAGEDAAIDRASRRYEAQPRLGSLCNGCLARSQARIPRRGLTRRGSRSARYSHQALQRIQPAVERVRERCRRGLPSGRVRTF